MVSPFRIRFNRSSILTHISPIPPISYRMSLGLAAACCSRLLSSQINEGFEDFGVGVGIAVAIGPPRRGRCNGIPEEQEPIAIPTPTWVAAGRQMKSRVALHRRDPSNSLLPSSREKTRRKYGEEKRGLVNYFLTPPTLKTKDPRGK